MKEALYILATVIISTTICAQNSFSYFRAGSTLLAAWDDASETVLFPGITLTPGLRLLQRKNFLASISMPITTGATFENNTFWGVDVPIMMDLSFFSATGNNKKARAGFMLGAGMAYINIQSRYDDINSSRIHNEFLGYRFHAGVSFGKGDSGDRIVILLIFGKNVTSRPGKVFGISLQGLLGNTKNYTARINNSYRIITGL